VVRVVTPGTTGDYERGMGLYSRGELREAVIAFRDAARSEGSSRMRADAVQSVVTLVARNIEQGGVPFFPRESRESGTAGREPVSIVVCSNRGSTLHSMQRNFVAALGDREHEFIAIADARSLCEGYNRGLEKARHGIVVFSHDDVELVSPRAFDAIEQALAENHVAGLAGSGLVRGPAVMWAGHPHLRGFVAMPVPGDAHACKATLFSLECGVLDGMQALDGFFFAARRDAALSVGFDATTFDGFHFYDLDFTYRAALAGLRVAVTTDVVAIHHSLGNFGDVWQRYAPRFTAKFPALDGVRGSNEHYSARLASRENAVRFYEEIRGLAAINPASGR
jgi:hypothetical protein